MSGQDKDEAAWREQLTAEEFYVLREKGTERASWLTLILISPGLFFFSSTLCDLSLS